MKKGINVNCGYALVNGIVFSSVGEAEKYCSEHAGLSDKDIQTDSPVVLAKCQTIARTSLPMLKEILSKFEDAWLEELSNTKKQIEIRDSAKKSADVFLELYQHNVSESTGKMTGRYESMLLLQSYISVLESIIAY